MKHDKSPLEEHSIETPDGEEFDIPVGGSLGLLALGDVGLESWRAKIESVKQEMAARTLERRAATDSDEAAERLTTRSRKFSLSAGTRPTGRSSLR